MTQPPAEARPQSRLNRSVVVSHHEHDALLTGTLPLDGPAELHDLTSRTICGDAFAVAPLLPHAFVDLLVLDPPYNLTKQFGTSRFTRRDATEYVAWFETVLDAFIPALKSNASVYVCADWKTSAEIYPALLDRFHIRNRITWEREKGRGAKANWKNSSEDIWFCTVGDSYTFNVDAVKLKRRVLAPYRSEEGDAKDWQMETEGAFRMTSPSNLWSDITVPFWSMAENTCHPTQKPEKLVAKLMLASSNPGDFVLDPLLGSGTTSVVAKKLGRNFLGIESDPHFAALAERRLASAEFGAAIQGYSDGVFWERNSEPQTRRRTVVVQQPLQL